MDLAEKHLSTEQIDFTAARIHMQLEVEERDRGGEPGKWYRQCEAELAEDKRAHGQVQ